MIFRVVVQSLSSVWLFVIPWTAACQASLSFTLSLGLLKLMFFESVMPCTISSSIAFSSFSQSFPASGSFPMSQLFTLGGQIIGASASASVFPLNIQGWFPLWLTDLISLLSKGLSWVFSSTTVWKDQFVGAQSSLWSSSLEKNIVLAIWIIVGKVMSLCVFFFYLFFHWKIVVLQNFVVFYQTSHESAIGIHISFPFWTSLPSPSPSHPSRLIQSPCLSFLSRTANSHWLSILHMVM